jgi:L-rhamnose mutarotase
MSTSSSSPQGPRRIGQFLYLKPTSIAEYKKCHAAVWPAVLEQIKDSNIVDCNFSLCPLPAQSNPPNPPPPPIDSIFLTLSPRPTLFASFKYTGTAFDADMARMAANEKVQEWWRMTDGMQESPIEGAVGSANAGGWWGQMEEVFHVG